MKITDFALIFVGITLPIIITVYVNVSFTIKAEEQEMYYKKIINAALDDASNQLKTQIRKLTMDTQVLVIIKSV